MKSRTVRTANSGFSIVELTISLAVTLLVVGAAFRLVDPTGAAFQVQPETADLQQRLRVASDTLSRDLIGAGGSPLLVSGQAPNPPIAPAVFPSRVGRLGADAPGSFNASRITVWSVEQTAPQARLASPLISSSGSVTIVPGEACHDGVDSCGFRTGMTVAVFGSSGAWDLFSVTGVGGSELTVHHNLRDSSTIHAAGESVVAQVTLHSYMLRNDARAGYPRLVRYDGAGAADQPVVEHVVDLRFEYLGEAQPPDLVLAGDPAHPRVTYGPPPPPFDLQPTAYPPGENCVFARTTSGAIAPRLSALAPGPVVVPLLPSMLTDGPWCPDSASPNRYDADLLRVRAVGVTIRVEAAIASLRGPAGPLFTRGGTSTNSRLVPDRVTRLLIAPRPLNLVR